MSNRKAGQNIGNNCFQTLRQQAEQNWDSWEIRWGKSSNCSPPCRKEEESKWSTAVWKDQRDRDWSSSCWALGVLQDRAQWGRYAEKALQESIQRLLLEAKSALSEATLCACSVAKSCPTLWESMNSSLPGSSVHGFPWQEYRSSLPFPSPEDLPHLRTKPVSPAL